MKKELTGISQKTLIKTTGLKLLLVLAALIWSAVMPAVSSAEWTIEAPDVEGKVGFYTSIATDSNNSMHISYYDTSNYALKYATNISGSWVIETIDINTDWWQGMYTSIAIDSNDKVHISYHANSALQYATNASGGWVIETVDIDTQGRVGLNTSIAIDSNDKVHISYYDLTNSDLKYATNASGIWVAEAIDTEGWVGDATSIAVDSSDNIHISYSGNNDIKYATNASGIWIIKTVDTEGDDVKYTSIAIDTNDRVHISYNVLLTSALKYATNASGNWVIETVDTGGWEGAYNSIAIDSNGNVHISYYDSTTANSDLKYATNASGNWVAKTLDNEGSVGAYTSIAIDSNDNLHVSYSNMSNYDLKYATNDSGNWTFETVDTGGSLGKYTSIDTDSNNNIHISYYDMTNYNLKYTTNTSGAWITEIIDASGESDTSIAIDSNDNMHISYYDATNNDLKYATNASGAWIIETVDTEGNVGLYTSIAIDSNDKVHISYSDSTNNALKYATNTSGAWMTESIETAWVVGKYTSIAIDSKDNVHISYLNDFLEDLRYATNASGTWVVETIDYGEIRQYTSIAIDSNDKVHISYHELDVGLKYVTNLSGVWGIEVVDTEGNVGLYSSIAIDSNNNVHISYYDWSNSDLKYATNASEGSWMVEIVDDGERLVFPEGLIGEHTSISLDSNDNVHISYYYRSSNDLKYATNAPGVQSVSAENAYYALITKPNAIMFDTRTVDEHNGYCPPWDQDCGGQIDTDTAYAGTPQWTRNGIKKLPITLPYWDAGINRSTGPPENEAQARDIIEGALAANIVDFDTSIYFISSTAYRSYHMIAWMNSQTFRNPATDETSSFTNLFNIDADSKANNDQGGVQEWNAAGWPIFDGTIVPPQVFSGYPEDGSIEIITNDIIFAAGVLEPTTGGFIYSDVTEVLLYVDDSDPVSMTQVDEAALRAFFSIPDDVVLPGKVYMVTKYLPDGIHTWNVRATNSAGISWNLNVLNGSAQGPGQRTLNVAACIPSGEDTDCNGRDDNCDGLIDNNYLSTETTCGVGVCAATGLTKCINGVEADTCTPGTPAESPEATCDDILDNDCDGLTDTEDSSDCPPTYTITATAGANGSISPSGDLVVDAGGDQTFTITPENGYQISDVLADGVSVGQVGSYTFTRISSDHTISAEFTSKGLRRGMRRGRRSR